MSCYSVGVTRRFVSLGFTFILRFVEWQVIKLFRKALLREYPWLYHTFFLVSSALKLLLLWGNLNVSENARTGTIGGGTSCTTDRSRAVGIRHQKCYE